MQFGHNKLLEACTRTLIYNQRSGDTCIRDTINCLLYIILCNTQCVPLDFKDVHVLKILNLFINCTNIITILTSQMASKDRVQSYSLNFNSSEIILASYILKPVNKLA